HSRDGHVVELQVTGAPRRLPSDVEDAAFRITQEGVNNVIKHAGSDRARVELEFDADHLRLSVVDSGVGFDPGAPSSGGKFGMSTMRERAEGIGGRLTVETAPGQGTRVTAELPLREAAP